MVYRSADYFSICTNRQIAFARLSAVFKIPDAVCKCYTRWLRSLPFLLMVRIVRLLLTNGDHLPMDGRFCWACWLSLLWRRPYFESNTCLGVKIDIRLSWSVHIASIKKHFTQKVRALKRMRVPPKKSVEEIYVNWYPGGYHGCHRHAFSDLNDFSVIKIKFPWREFFKSAAGS